MLSNTSSSPVSPEPPRSRKEALRSGWPTLVALPALIGLLEAGVAAPLIAMFFGPDFGLSGGREAFSPWAIAVIILLGFWSAKALDRSPLSSNASSAVLVVAGVAIILAWWAIEPIWDVMAVLRDPISLVNDNGHLVLPLLIGLASWIQGLRLAFEPGLFGPEITRERVRNSIVVLAAALALAGMIGGDMGDAGVSAAIISLPVVLVTGAGAIAAAEMDATRKLAMRRHSTVPGWDRWMRVFAGSALTLLVITGIGALIVGPGALDLLVEGLRGAWQVIATVLLWIVFGIVYVLYWTYRIIAWIINSIFGDVLGPVEMPQMEGQPAPPEEEQPLQQPEPLDSEYVTLLRWIALGIALIVVAIIVFTMLRRREPAGEGETVDEERSSVFSAALARKQLRDLFRRKPRPERPRKLDLDRDPGSVRETMLYLQVLAERQDAGRKPHETPRDFTERLGGQWSGLAEPLRALRERYERTRYGETEEDRRAALDAWHAIWSARKDAPGTT
jgi:hypothetical protein